MEQEKPKVTVDLPLSLYKAFQHKRIDERLTVKAVIRQLIELWVKGDIVLSGKAVKPTRRKKT